MHYLQNGDFKVGKIAMVNKLTLNYRNCNTLLLQLETRLRRLLRARNNADGQLAKKRAKANKLRFEICYIRGKSHNKKQQFIQDISNR